MTEQTKADAMKERGDVDGLIEQLSDKKGLYTYDMMRVEAAKALVDLGDARAVEALIDALEDPEEQVVWAAADCLGTFGGATR